MAKAEGATGELECLNIDFMRSLVKQYSELGQWTSALFWADAAAATGSGNGTANGDDIWLLASVMLSHGELHRAAHAVVSRGLHRTHLLCLGVAMRAHITAKEPEIAINLIEECEMGLLDCKSSDQTHNRALSGVFVWQARALWALERREAGASSLMAALRADVACYEALDLLLEQHALTPAQEYELVEGLPISQQLGAAEAALVRAAYRERLNRYTALPETPTPIDCPISASVECVRKRTMLGAECVSRRLAAGGRWAGALGALGGAGLGAAPALRVACLVELRRPAALFALAHALVDAYPTDWRSWYAVGCYYYLIGKSEFARRYLSKAKSLEPNAGCVWLAYGHSFANDNEHDQAMAAYFKASQLMGGCHLPPLYVGVECSLLNNTAMCERFLARAAILHASPREAGLEKLHDRSEGSSWQRLVPIVNEPHVAHEAGAAAFAARDYTAAHALFLRALDTARGDKDISQLSRRWAATLDALGHSSRRVGQARAACEWHQRALVLRPKRAHSHAARGLALALAGDASLAARALHAALALDPDLLPAAALLDALLDRAEPALADEEIPQFPFPPVNIPIAEPAAASPLADHTNNSDMSMSFD